MCAAPQVVDYVGRYTHRVAISNHRILEIEDGQVKFHWRDLGPGERRLGVYDPFHMAHGIEMSAENLRISKDLEGREDLEFAGIEGLLQVGQE